MTDLLQESRPGGLRAAGGSVYGPLPRGCRSGPSSMPGGRLGDEHPCPPPDPAARSS